MAGVVQRMINREARLWGNTLTSPLLFFRNPNQRVSASR